MDAYISFQRQSLLPFDSKSLRDPYSEIVNNTSVLPVAPVTRYLRLFTPAFPINPRSSPPNSLSQKNKIPPFTRTAAEKKIRRKRTIQSDIGVLRKTGSENPHGAGSRRGLDMVEEKTSIQFKEHSVRSLKLFFSVCLLALPTTPPRLVCENTEAKY